MIPHQDILTWYLTEGTSYFERSTFGAALDAVIFLAFGSQTCDKCDGVGILDQPWTLTHRVAPNGDKVLLPSPIAVPTGKDCPKCGGRGVIQVQLINRDPEEPLTCRPKHCHHNTGKAAPPDSVLTLYAIVSRRLSRMPKALSLALQAAYGDEGEANASTRRGRAWAVMPLTVAGRKLLEHHRTLPDAGENQFRAVLALTEMADEENQDPARKRLLAEAVEQAVRLTRRAEEYWTALESRSRG